MFFHYNFVNGSSEPMQFIYFELYFKKYSCASLVGLNFRQRKDAEEAWNRTTNLLVFKVCSEPPASSRKREDLFFVVTTAGKTRSCR